MTEQKNYEPYRYNMLVEVFRLIAIAQIPECVLAHTKNGGAFHGMFAK